MKKESYDLIEWKNTGKEENRKQEKKGPFPLNRLKWTKVDHKMK